MIFFYNFLFLFEIILFSFWNHIKYLFFKIYKYYLFKKKYNVLENNNNF